MRRFVLTEPVFKTATLFLVGCSFERLTLELKRYRREPGLNVGQCGQMFTFTTRPPWRVVWSEKVDLGVVLHETFHLVTRICADKDIPIVAHLESGHSGDETAAYLFEFFARGVLARLGARVKRG